MSRPLHICMTVNAAWNIANFRMPLVQALLDDGHRITVLAPEDHAAHKLVDAGCEYVHLPMDIKGLNPLRDIGLFLRFRKYFNEIKPDIVLGFTIKNNLFGALAAKSLGLRFLPNVTGLGTAFLSGGLLLQIARVLYVVAFHRLPVIFFQNRDDRDLFVDLKIVTPDQTRLLPGSGIDLTAFVPAPYPDDNDALRFLFVGRVIRDKGVVEFVEAARIVRQARSEIRCQILGEIGFANRSGIPRAEVNGWVKEGAIEYLGTTSDVRPLISHTMDFADTVTAFELAGDRTQAMKVQLAFA